MSWAEKLLTALDDGVDATNSMVSAFDIDVAIGDQLDVIGEIVGVSRNLNFDPSTASPPAAASPVLDDATYRILLKATIGINQWDGKMSSIKSLWDELFPDGNIMLQDNLDMSITAYARGVFSDLIIAIIENGLIIPRPEGIQINYEFGEMPFFGFDTDDEFIAGFDKGKWS
jgi:hypothetical protein